MNLLSKFNPNSINLIKENIQSFVETHPNDSIILLWNLLLVSDKCLERYLKRVVDWFEDRDVYERTENKVVEFLPVYPISEINIPNHGRVFIQQQFDLISSFEISGVDINQVEQVEFGLLIPLEFYESEIPRIFVPLKQASQNPINRNLFELTELVTNTFHKSIQFGLNIIFTQQINVADLNCKVKIEYCIDTPNDFIHVPKRSKNKIEPTPKFVVAERPVPGVKSMSIIFRYKNLQDSKNNSTFIQLTKNTKEFQHIKFQIQSFLEIYSNKDDLYKEWLQKLKNHDLLEQTLSEIVIYFQNQQLYQKQLNLTDWFFRNSFETIEPNSDFINLFFVEKALGPVKIESLIQIDYVLFGVFVPFSHNTNQLAKIKKVNMTEDLFVPFAKSLGHTYKIVSSNFGFGNKKNTSIFEYEFCILPEQDFILKSNTFLGIQIHFINNSQNSKQNPICKVYSRHFIPGPKSQKVLFNQTQ